MTAIEQGSPNHLSEARSNLAGATSRWGRRAAGALAAYHLAQQARQLITSYRENHSYSVTVLEGDEIYDLVQEWVLARMPARQQRALLARTVQHRDGRRLPRPEPVDASPDSDRAPVVRRVMLRYDGARRQHLNLDGHAVTVHMEAAEQGEQRSSGSDYVYEPRKVVFQAADQPGRQAVVDFLQSIADTLVEGQRAARLVIASRWGHWRNGQPLHGRTLESVVLPGAQLDDLMTDVRRFLASEDRYQQLSLPWHRGYLFHGPPGVGKTSTARAVASVLGLDVYWLPLSDLEGDANLNELVGAIPERCVLLLEDVDVAHAATERDDERKGITLAGLLNCLDGIITPRGLIVMMTTNDRAALDDALIRKGRVHYEVPMTFLVPEQAARLIAHLTGLPCEPHDLPTHPDPQNGVQFPAITAADLVGAVSEHMHDPAAGYQAAMDLLDDRAQPQLDAVRGNGEFATVPAAWP